VLARPLLRVDPVDDFDHRRKRCRIERLANDEIAVALELLTFIRTPSMLKCGNVRSVFATWAGTKSDVSPAGDPSGP